MSSRDHAIAAFIELKKHPKFLSHGHPEFQDIFIEAFDYLTCPDCEGKGDAWEPIIGWVDCETCNGKGWRYE